MLLDAEGNAVKPIIMPQSRPVRRDTTIARAILAFASVIVGVLAIANVLGDPELYAGWPYVVVSLGVVWLAIFYAYTYRIFGSIYSFVNIYVFTLCVFHLSHVVIYVLGDQTLSYLVDPSVGSSYERASWYVLLSFSAFGMGCAVTKARDPNKSAVSPEAVKEFAFWIGLGLLLASVVAFFLLLVSVGSILNYTRIELYAGVGDTRGLGFMLIVLPSALTLLLCAARTVPERAMAYVVTAVSVLAIMFLGERSFVLFPGLVGLVVWHKVGKRIPGPVMITMVLAVLLTVPAISMIRSAGRYADIDATIIGESFRESQVKNTFIELGSCHGVLANVIRWVPVQEPYRFGETYADAIRAAVPNFGLRQSANGRDIMSGAIDTTRQAREMSAADWYIFRVNSWMFDVGGGGGFSFIAEAYLNFGLTGVLAIMFGMGWVLTRLDYKDLSVHPYWLVTAAIIVWPLLKTIRNDFENFGKPVGLILTTLLIWWALSHLMGKGAKYINVRRPRVIEVLDLARRR